MKFVLQILLLPLDLVFLVFDAFRALPEWVLRVFRGTPHCTYCGYSNTIGENARSCPAAKKYQNLWVFRTVCPCAQAPNANSDAPWCNRNNGYNRPILGVPLTCLTLSGLMLGAVVGVLHYTHTPLRDVANVVPKPAPPESPESDLEAAKREATRLLDQANVLANQDRFNEALILYLNAQKLDPDHAEINYRLGFCQLKLQRENQAEASLEQAIALDPDHLEANVLLSEIYLLKMRAKKAIGLLQQVTDKQPDHLKALQLLLHAHAENYQPDIARQYAEKVLATAGTNVNARVNVASFYLGQGLLDEAESTLAELIQAPTPAKEVVYTQARIHLQRNQPAEAEILLLRLPKPEGIDFILESLKIDIAAGQGRRREAAQQYEKLASRSDTPSEIKLGYLGWLVRSGQSDAALSLAATLANANDPREIVDAEFLRAKIYYQKRLYSDALKYCRVVIGINPDHLAALFIKAQAHLAQNDIANAQNTLERMLEIKPDHLEAGLHLAMIHTAEQRWQEAQDLYEKLSSAHPDKVAAPVLLAALHFKLGQFPETIRACERAMEIDPTATTAINRMTLALIETEQLDRAMATISGPYHAQPENPAIADAYAWLLVKQGKVAAALPLLEQLCAQQPGSLEQFHLGMAYAVDGRPQLAREKLEAALSLSPDFPGAEQARAELRRINQRTP